MSRQDSRYGDSSIPIPTYEEAIGSRPGSVSPLRAAQEGGAEAEREELLGGGVADERQRRRHGEYHTPFVESARTSEDSDLTLPEVEEEDDEQLRHDMEEMDVIDPGQQSRPSRGRLRLEIPKGFARLRESLSFIHLPSFSDRWRSMPTFTFRFPFSSNHYRPNWPIIARFFALFVIVAVVYAMVVFRIFTMREVALGQRYPEEQLRAYIQAAASRENLQHNLIEVSFDDHIAGTKGDFFLANWVRDKFLDAGLEDTFVEDYFVYLNYPRPHGRRVAIVDPPELRWEAPLEEERASDDPKKHQTAAFHGHSRSGNVTGRLVYANYGSREDFAWLKENGVDLEGSIALVRYYGTQGDRALKVKAAELAGAAGCLIYSDPMEDGFRKGKPWPDGPWRPRDSIQRGSVSLMSWVVGDVLTPGWASTPDAKRISTENNPGLNNIPSLPLSARAARRLLESLEGKGVRVKDDWKGGIPDIEWWTGSGKDSPMVNLMNMQDEVEQQPIRNVLAKIDGIETPEKTIWVGNHRDAWCFGSIDPGTGTSVLLEVARIFGQLKLQGWQPLRTIVFASWDGEEYNLIGSTEHVEEHMMELRNDGVAYLNVDVGVAGDEFRAAGSPVFRKLLLEILNRISDEKHNQTLAQRWKDSNSKLDGLGAGSDYVAFQDMAGCSSLDFGFEGKKYGFPYHSCYETFEYVERMVDPNFDYHHMLVQVWALLVLELADSAILPFDMQFYASEIKRYVDQLKLDSNGPEKPGQTGQPRLKTGALEDAAALFVKNAGEFNRFEDEWRNHVMANAGRETREIAVSRWAHNARMSNFETHLLDIPFPDEDREGGVPGRTQFKHIIFGPQAWSGYEEAYFPAIRDAMDEGRWDDAQRQLDIATNVLRHAAHKLLH